MKRYLSIGLVLIVQASLFSAPINAIENGESVLSDSNAVAVGFDYHGGCGGALYSPRILLTAAHCTYGVKLPSFEVYPLADDGVHVWRIGNLSSNPIKSKKIFRPEDFRWQGTNGSWGYHNDFAVVVLDGDLGKVNKIKIPSKEEFETLVQKQSEVTLLGFGKQYADDNRDKKPTARANFNLISQQEADKTINEYRSKWNRSGLYAASGHFKIPVGKITPCDGDSGSPIFLQDSETRWYLGAASYILGSPNCGRGEWGMHGGIQSFYASYQSEDLIKLAEKYVADNPYVEPKTTNTGLNKKITVTCVKGKTTKKVRGVTPKCPGGYKQITLDKAKPVTFAPCSELGQLKNGFSCVLIEKKLSWLKMTLSKAQNGKPVIGTSCYRNNMIALGYGLNSELVPLLCTFRDKPGGIPSWSSDTTINSGN
jgi:hypothetical protein